MKREVEEETGLVVQGAVKLWAGEPLLLSDPCRRGANLHRWHVFRVETERLPRLSDEGRVIGWYLEDEIRELAARDQLTAPVQFIFARLGWLDTPSEETPGDQ